jgi:hypothetical protein
VSCCTMPTARRTSAILRRLRSTPSISIDPAVGSKSIDELTSVDYL